MPPRPIRTPRDINANNTSKLIFYTERIVFKMGCLFEFDSIATVFKFIIFVSNKLRFLVVTVDRIVVKAPKVVV